MVQWNKVKMDFLVAINRLADARLYYCINILVIKNFIVSEKSTLDF